MADFGVRSPIECRASSVGHEQSAALGGSRLVVPLVMRGRLEITVTERVTLPRTNM